MRFLRVGEQQVLTDDGGRQHFIHRAARLHGERRLVVHALIGDAETVQKIVNGDFFREPPCGVCRAPLFKMQHHFLFSPCPPCGGFFMLLS